MGGNDIPLKKMVVKIGWANILLNDLWSGIGDNSFVSFYMRRLYRLIRKTKNPFPLNGHRLLIGNSQKKYN